MNRRIKFISIFLALFLTFSLSVACRSEQVAADDAAELTAEEKEVLDSSAVKISYDGSRSLDFGKEWKFLLVNAAGVEDPSGKYENAQDPSYDDSAWRILNLPHDWSIELVPVKGPGTGTDPGTGFLQGGLGWYRKTFILPVSMKDKKISIEFDGIYMDSFVYLNGELLSNHHYGYTGFSFDLTELVHTDGVTPNVIAIKVQNPLPSSRWYSGSGIYRNVRLVVTDDIFVKRWGTFVTTTDLENTYKNDYANVHIKTDISNESGKAETIKLISRIIDSDGKVVAESNSDTTLDGKEYTFENDIRVDSPILWAFDNPYLYTLESDLVVEGNVIDTYITTFGIRYFEIDPKEGFSLNGEYTKIQGVNLHHDLGALGSSVNYDAILRQMKIMKDMGVNAIRTAHNPPAPEILQAAENSGILLMVEAFDCWQTGKNTYDYGRFFNENGDADIKEMVNAAKNSPSVIMWSIGNEIRDPDVGTAQMLIDAIKSIDTTRPVVWGSNGYKSIPDDNSPFHKILLLLDGVGLNYNTASSVDAMHLKYPDKFIFESESSSSTSTRGIYQEPNNLNTGENYTPGRRGASSFDNNMASWTMPGEYGLKKDRDRKFFIGEFLWSGFDYIGEPTPYFNTFPVKSSFFGAVDTAGFLKDLYYLFKSQWTSEPMVHLLPMNWTDYGPGEVVQVWAYANVDTVELLLNGKSMGIRTFDHKTTVDGRDYLETTEATFDDKTMGGGRYPGSYTSPNGSAGKLHLTWNIPFEEGTLTAIATKDGEEVARDEIRTAGSPYTMRLTPDNKVITADGKSLSFITIEVIDSNGVVVPGADNLIDFTVTGGTLVGVDNGRQESTESYKVSYREAFNGKALAIIQSVGTPGSITVKAESSGLLPAATTIYSLLETGQDESVAIEPVFIRTMVGEDPILPETVQGIYANNTQRSLPAEWGELEGDMNSRCGIYTINGQVTGENTRAEAIITVYDVAGIESYSTAVPTETAPALPTTVRLVYNDGVDQFVPVTWDAIDPEEYESPGQFTVKGSVTETAVKAEANIRVTDDVIANQNIASSESRLQPIADASYTGTPEILPASMLDGNRTSGGWSNYYNKQATDLLPAFSKARLNDWVSITWPNPQKIGNLTVYFAISNMPQSMKVSYWDGSSFAEVNNADINWATEQNQATTITFELVETIRLRLDMESKSPGTADGFLRILELEVTGDVVTYNTTASLTDLKIEGETIEGFDSNKTEYTISVDGAMPEISAEVADNGRMVIIPPLMIPGMAAINVISEDGLIKNTYYIDFILSD
ncbi:MAG: glycoside hydrolase family 2 TIM barrel-domain containing protein [Actinomycetota bacterium]